MIEIEVTPLAYHVTGIVERSLTAAIGDLDPDMLRGASTLEIAEALGALLRGRGHEVEIDVGESYQLQHRWCGATFSRAEWRAEPYFDRPDKRGGVIHFRRCRCGTPVSLVAMRLVTAAH